MGQGPGAKPDNLTLSSETYLVEEKNNSYRLTYHGECPHKNKYK